MATNAAYVALTIVTTTGLFGIPHHVGCAVRTLEEGFATFADALGPRKRSRAFEVSSQKVRVSFLELRPGFYLELVAPTEGNTNLARYLSSGFYHLSYLVDDLAVASAHLRKSRFVPLPAFESEAFDRHPCQFFVSPRSHLVELCQMSAASFEAFFAAQLEATA